MVSVVLVVLAAAALALVVTAGVRVRRTQLATRVQFTRSLHDLSARLDDLASELADAVARVREEGLRARVLASLGGTLELDEVLVRCAEAAASLPGVAAASITVEIDGARASAGVGLDPTTAEPVAGPPGGEPVRAVGLSYHYRDGIVGTESVRSAVAVPIESGEDRLGFITVFGTDEEPPVAGPEFRTLEAIAHASAAALEKGRQTAKRLPPERDALTGLAGRQVLHETLAVEVARAQRSGRKLAVSVLDVDDLREANAQIGQQAADRLLTEIAAQLRASLRPGDRVFRCGGDEFAIVLPDSGRIEAEATFARAQASLRRLTGTVDFAPSLSAGIAELKPGDDGVSLFERAERALRHAKAAGKGTAA